MAEKPLNELTKDEFTELNRQIEARLARQQEEAEAGGKAEVRTAATKIQAIVRGRKGREEAEEAKALTQEGVLAVEYAKPDYLAELITKLDSLPSLPDHVTKNDDGTYTYHYDAGNGAA